MRSVSAAVRQTSTDDERRAGKYLIGDLGQMRIFVIADTNINGCSVQTTTQLRSSVLLGHVGVAACTPDNVTEGSKGQ
jgi:D-serine deaminase-like pyridoxal phosphate-dependent protein